MKFERPSVEAVGTALTLARYFATAEPIARRVQQGKPILLPMVGTVVADVYDGAILRQFDNSYGSETAEGSTTFDTPFRRIVDGVVDHATVGRVAWEVGKKNRHALPYIGIIAARAAFAAGGLNGTHLVTTGEVTKGRKKQKATHLSTALFGWAASTGNKPLTHITGILASSIALITTPAHFKDLGVAGQGDGVYREL